jgi:multicomponent Na+:H+ antiporter subunit D
VNEQYPALIVVVPLLSALVVFIVGWFNRRCCYILSVATLAVCCLLSVCLMREVMVNGNISYWMSGWAPPWGIEYFVDHLSGFMLMVVSFIALLTVIASKKSLDNEIPGKDPAFYSLYLLLIAGLLGIVISGDLFNIFVFFEITSIACYVLIACGRNKAAPIASFNYLILGTIGASFYLIGVGFVYIATGSLNIQDLSTILPGMLGSNVILVACAFFTIGIAIKAGLFPVHTWMPDSYSTAPDAVSPLIASLMTKVSAYVLIRLMFTLFPPEFSLETIPIFTILGWLSVAAIIAGGLWALAQKDLKTMLSYILVVEVGYIVMGISLGNRAGLTGSILHIMNDAVMMACMFLIVVAVAYKTGKDISQVPNLNRKMPFTMAAFVVAAISLIGLPPTCGFFSKWYLLLGTIDAQQWAWTAALLIGGLINAVLFFRIIETVYFKMRTEHGSTSDNHGCTMGNHGVHEKVVMNEAPFTMLFPILALAAAILVLGPFSGKIIEYIIQYAVPVGF